MGPNSYQLARVEEQQRTFITQVYLWMTLALGITAVTAMFVASNAALFTAIVGNSILFFGLIIAELVAVMALSAAIQRMSVALALSVFLGYSVLNGLTLSVIFVAFTEASIATTFFITAGTFGAMSLYGFVTKTDLTKWGNLLIMVLVGFIIASVVNVFLNSAAIYWILTFVGVLVFVGLIAYDTQRIKKMSVLGLEDSEAEQKGAIVGALVLYLDFINLFLLLLRLFGRRR